jgi:hypothetical protein
VPVECHYSLATSPARPSAPSKAVTAVGQPIVSEP